MKYRYLIGLLVITACGAEQDNRSGEDSTTKENKVEVIKNEVDEEFRTYLAQYELEDETVISEEFKEKYISEALDELEGSYSYEDFSTFTFHYGTVLYKSDEMEAVTFNLSGDDGWNEHDVDFMATYSLTESALVDVLMIRSFTDFEGYFSKGYNTSYALDYEIQSAVDESIAFILNCTESRSNYNFNEEFYTAEEIEEMSKEVATQLQYEVLSSGEIIAP